MSFHGTLDELKSAADAVGLNGEWHDTDGSKHCLRAKTGEIVNWWPGKGTLQFQGKANSALTQQLELHLTSHSEPVEKPRGKSAKIFIVHGHDQDARDQLELVLRRLGLEPFILQNNDGGGNTIIEALEQNIYKDSVFGIILLTPDDYGYSAKMTEADRQPRARQNVVLEMGMTMAALGREKIAILQKGAVERPSDTDGILRIEFNGHVREAVPKLVQRLQSAGFILSASAISAASA